MNSFIQKMPKAELHLHLEGAVRPDTASFLYNQLNDPVDSLQIKDFYQFDDLMVFINGMKQVSDNIRTPEHLYRITRELLETCALQNIIYLEFDCAFQKYVNLGLSLKQVTSAITDCMAEAEANYGIKSRVIVNLQRSHGAVTAQELVREIIAIDNPLIVGIGLSGYEKTGKVADYVPVFSLARRAGLHLTAHAGEISGAESVWQAIELLGVERIDHGTNAIEDPHLLNYLEQKQIPLTQCLTSNIRLSVCEHYKTHPFPKFLKKGLCVTLNTDDPEVFQVSLTGEYQKAASYFGLNNNDMIRIVNNTINASFMNEEEKKEMRRKVQQQCQELVVMAGKDQVLI